MTTFALMLEDDEFNLTSTHFYSIILIFKTKIILLIQIEIQFHRMYTKMDGFIILNVKLNNFNYFCFLGKDYKTLIVIIH